MHDYTHSADRTGSRAVKWSRETIAAMCGNPDALPFWVADMDLPVDECISKALAKELELSVIGYRDSSSLLPAFVSFMEKRHATVLDPEATCYAQGMLHAIALALETFTRPGDKVLLPFPSYHPFIEMIPALGRTTVPYRLKETEKGFAFDRGEYAKASGGCSAILFCSPHNPTGIVFPEEDLEFVLALAKERGQFVISDEIHADLAHPGHVHTPMVKANANVHADCVTFAAASKSFNIAGEHCAFCCFSSKALKETFAKRQAQLMLSSPGYSVAVMAEAAYTQGLPYNRELCAHLASNLDRIGAFLKANTPGIRLQRPEASFIAFLDFSPIWDAVVRDAEANPGKYPTGPRMANFLGWRGDVCLNDGSWFGEGYEKWARFNFGCGTDLLEKGLDGLKRAWDYAQTH